MIFSKTFIIMVSWLVIILIEWPFLFWIDRFWRVRKSTSPASKELFIIYLKLVKKIYDVLKSLTGCPQMILYHLISIKFTRNNFPGISFSWWDTFPEIILPGWKAHFQEEKLRAPLGIYDINLVLLRDLRLHWFFLWNFISWNSFLHDLVSLNSCSRYDCYLLKYS